MKNKKVSSFIIFIGFVVIPIGILIGSGIFHKEPVSTIEGEVQKVTGMEIIFTDGVGSFSINVVQESDVPVFNENGSLFTIRSIQVGQQILVKYTGGIMESNPGQFSDIVEIRIK